MKANDIPPPTEADLEDDPAEDYASYHDAPEEICEIAQQYIRRCHAAEKARDLWEKDARTMKANWDAACEDISRLRALCQEVIQVLSLCLEDTSSGATLALLRQTWGKLNSAVRHREVCGE